MARSCQRCQTFEEAVNVIGKEGFLMFLGVSCEVIKTSNQEFSLILHENPLASQVVLPSQYGVPLWYSNIICGVIKGALTKVGLSAKCFFV